MALHQEGYSELLRRRKELLQAFDASEYFDDDLVRKIANVQSAILAIEAERALEVKSAPIPGMRYGVDGYLIK